MSGEDELRARLQALAASARGRRLLQLALRGIARGERGVTAGCWVRRGDAGCLFQHAYWEGVRAGVFADRGRPGDWIGAFVGPHHYGTVIAVIESFDRLARAGYSDREPRALLPARVRLRQQQWSAAVERLLLEVLDRDRAAADRPMSAEAAPLSQVSDEAEPLSHRCPDRA